jgi:hypothetical protein
MAGLTKLRGWAVLPAFFSGHQVMPAQTFYLPPAQFAYFLIGFLHTLFTNSLKTRSTVIQAGNGSQFLRKSAVQLPFTSCFFFRRLKALSGQNYFRTFAARFRLPYVNLAAAPAKF